MLEPALLWLNHEEETVDDQHFDPKTDRADAEHWIRIAESSAAQVARQKDLFPLLQNWLDSEALSGTQISSHPVRILELGSGQGACGRALRLPDHFQYIGLEAHPLLHARAVAQNPAPEQFRFLLGNLYHIPLDSESV